MPDKKDRYFLALVSFEKMEGYAYDDLPNDPQVHGATGYMMIRARDEDAMRTALVEELKQAMLRLVEIDDITELDGPEVPEGIDDHLAENVRNWEPEKRTVWGTLFTYTGDGEA